MELVKALRGGIRLDRGSRLQQPESALRRDRGLTIIEVPDLDTARYWAGRVAEGCGWPQELRQFGQAPQV